MIALNAHFDGKVLVPDEPLQLAPNQKVRLQVETIDPPTTKPKRVIGRQVGQMCYLGPGWDDPLPDDFWDHNKEDKTTP